MDLEELRGFMTVVETGSFLGAATQLEVPRGTLRRRIDALEARAGVPLLERSARGVTATEAGMVLVQRGHRLLEESATLLAAVREVGSEPTGTLRFCLPTGLPPSVLVAYIELARVFVPKLCLSMQVREDPLAGLLEDVDIAIHFGARDPKGPWYTRELLHMPVHVLASPDYIEKNGRPETIEALHHHRLGAWHGPEMSPHQWPLIAGGHFEVAPVLISNDPHVLREQARAGAALMLLPDANLDFFGLPVDALTPVLAHVVGTSVALKLSVSEAIAKSPRVSQVIDLIRQFLEHPQRRHASTEPL